jgi:predicted RNase H-like HicB family nuclease
MRPAQPRARARDDRHLAIQPDLLSHFFLLFLFPVISIRRTISDFKFWIPEASGLTGLPGKGILNNERSNKEKKMRQVVVYQGEDELWVAECPSLPGCVSQGETREAALNNIREAIEGYIKALEEDNLPVPPERFEVMVVAV